MAIIKEFREFFLRNTQVNSGSKPDQEVGFPVSYTVTTPTGIVTVFNRFLKGNYPSENVDKKLFESLTFKLNPEDTATTTVQGLVRTADDSEVKANQTYSDGFKRTVQPYQVPTVEEVVNVDTLDSPFDNIATDSFPTDVIDVSLGGASTRNQYTVKTSSNLNAFFSNLLTTLYNFINTWDVTLEIGQSDTDIGVQLITDLPTGNSTKLKHYYLVNENWKTIGSADVMANGEPVSDFASGWSAPDSYNGLAIRKTWDGKLAIRGGLKATTNLGAGVPILYFPMNYSPSTFGLKPDLIAFDENDIMIPLNITGHGLYLRSASMLITAETEVRIPETIISLT